MAPGRARKRDANEPEIIEVLEALGASVCALDKPLDLLVGYQGENYLLEVKNGNLPPSHRKLTDDQNEHFRTWKGTSRVVLNRDEALDAVGATPRDLGIAIAETLEGACQGLPGFAYEIDGVCEALDEIVFECAGCQWWCEISEADEGDDGQNYCRDCA